jgi:hypothetical protein
MTTLQKISYYCVILSLLMDFFQMNITTIYKATEFTQYRCLVVANCNTKCLRTH